MAHALGGAFKLNTLLDFSLSFVVLYTTTAAMVVYLYLYLYLYLYVRTQGTQFDTQFHSLNAKRVMRDRRSMDTFSFSQGNLLSLSNNCLPSCMCYLPLKTRVDQSHNADKRSAPLSHSFTIRCGA